MTSNELDFVHAKLMLANQDITEALKESDSAIDDADLMDARSLITRAAGKIQKVNRRRLESEQED